MTAAEQKAWLLKIGKRVRLERLRRELTQEQLAQATGISRSFIGMIEKGTHSCDLVRLWQISRALDYPLTALLED